jgi:hypothetical protein
LDELALNLCQPPAGLVQVLLVLPYLAVNLLD